MRHVGNLLVSTPSTTEIAVTREFNAPRHLVYRALTEPALIRQWLSGPPGGSMSRCEMDARVDGTYRYEWEGPDGVRMGMGGVCQVVDPPAIRDAVLKTPRADGMKHGNDNLSALLEHLSLEAAP